VISFQIVLFVSVLFVFLMTVVMPSSPDLGPGVLYAGLRVSYSRDITSFLSPRRAPPVARTVPHGESLCSSEEGEGNR